MAKYKVWLTIKDPYGNTKEVDSGNIDIDVAFDALNQNVLDYIEESLPLDDYLKKEDYLKAEDINFLATDAEVKEEVSNIKSIKYSSFSS